MSEMYAQEVSYVWSGTQVEFDAGTDADLVKALGVAGSIAITTSGNWYKSDGGSWVTTHVDGNALVSAYYPDVTTFNSTIVTPVAGLSIAFITAPAGCYAVNIRTANTTVGTVITAFSGLCYIERNGDANATQSYILQAGGEVTMYVDPGDTIEFMGSAGCAGSVLVTPLG